MRNLFRASALAGFGAGLMLFTTSCNLFAFMDQPGDNEEYLSKARACFDEGDIDCAREFYAKLSGDYVDIRESEIAFTVLYEFGIDMGAFMEAFGDGGGGSGLTVLANRILEKGTPTAATRVQLHSAYAAHANITGNTELAGLVKFLGALAFAAHILAENAGSGGFSASDVVNDPAACLASGPGCLAGCPTSSDLSNGDGGDIDGTINGPAGLDLFHTAIIAMDDGLTMVGAEGKFSSTSGIADDLLAAGADGCYRQGMLDQGIGFQPANQN